MGLRKYVGDYEKQYIIKPNGKPGVTAVYKGKYFRFVANGVEIRAARARFAILSLLGTAFAVAPLLYQSVGSHTMYVALPHVVGLFPLFYLLLGVYSFCFSETPLIREYRDKTEGRIPGASLVCACLYGAVAVAQVVCCALSGFSLPDVMYFVFLFASSLSFAAIFLMRSVLKTEECKKNGEKINK